MLLWPFQRVVATCVALLASDGAGASEVLRGPYRGEVVRVVDGDTVAVRVSVWLQEEVSVLVRLRGVDAPELHGRCSDETARAVAAREALRRALGDGRVVLSRIEGDKYYGRVLADVATLAGSDAARQLLAGGFARPYAGGKRQPWCGLSAQPFGEVPG